MPASRRGFLRGLTTLPLIGGGVTLIGAPTAVAEPTTRELLRAYDAWLHFERCSLKAEYEGGYRRDDVMVWSLQPDGTPYDLLPMDTPGSRFHMAEPRRGAADRAALVLATVGCDWREGGR
ncbi:hypothetical protein JRF84_31075 [Methylobacterium organophilum]|uniref:hypothetical protein n=1 Tax=Methylobacterium organophilum TaxID=410 RepID=UPI0019D149B1|nr:hypothetical protein [Methylobacterium organophilum]MBN6824009.1 hypothetical protein [Methylobacterium organophilum]